MFCACSAQHSSRLELVGKLQGVEGVPSEEQQESEVQLLEGVVVRPDWQVCLLSLCLTAQPCACCSMVTAGGSLHAACLSHLLVVCYC